MPKPPLTRRQREILDFFREYCAVHGMSPTLEEIAQNFGVNKVTIFGHVSELERKGVISRASKGASRALQLVEASTEGTGDGGRVNILGAIAAGSPIEAIETPEQLDLKDLVPTDRDVYALRVRGESMIDDGIRDGDLVLVESRKTARNGETVVAILEGEQATLKRFYREKGRIRLQPANATMDPILVEDVEIRGVVIGVVRRY